MNRAQYEFWYSVYFLNVLKYIDGPTIGDLMSGTNMVERGWNTVAQL